MAAKAISEPERNLGSTCRSCSSVATVPRPSELQLPCSLKGLKPDSY